MSDSVDTELPARRSEALAAGQKYFFTGKPCKHGHLEKRAAISGHCLECDRARQRDRMANDPAYREIHRKSSLTYQNKRLADPEKRAAIRAREAELHRASESRRANKAAADHLRNARDQVKKRRRVLQTKRYHVLKNDPVAQDKAKQSRAGWYVRHKLKAYFKCATRRAYRAQATPPWLTSDMMNEMVAIYREARQRTEETGIPHEVDHICPLKGENVCGLHVPWNLQVLTEEANRAKRNKVDHL